ncbi:hypothetical protein J6590_049902 [Homalodisca vitripennis]|nr:hypothetical protein J6590_049902 [Homalodisca vitripennis]
MLRWTGPYVRLTSLPTELEDCIILGTSFWAKTSGRGYLSGQLVEANWFGRKRSGTCAVQKCAGGRPDVGVESDYYGSRQQQHQR